MKFYFTQKKVRKHRKITDRIIEAEQLYGTIEEMPLSQDVLPYIPQALKDVLSDRKNYSILRKIKAINRLARIKTKSKTRSLTSSIKEGAISVSYKIRDFFDSIFTGSQQYTTTTINQIPKSVYIERNDQKIIKLNSKLRLEEISIIYNEFNTKRIKTEKLYSKFAPDYINENNNRIEFINKNIINSMKISTEKIRY